MVVVVVRRWCVRACMWLDLFVCVFFKNSFNLFTCFFSSLFFEMQIMMMMTTTMPIRRPDLLWSNTTNKGRRRRDSPFPFYLSLRHYAAWCPPLGPGRDTRFFSRQKKSHSEERSDRRKHVATRGCAQVWAGTHQSPARGTVTHSKEDIYKMDELVLNQGKLIPFLNIKLKGFNLYAQSSSSRIA